MRKPGREKKLNGGRCWVNAFTFAGYTCAYHRFLFIVNEFLDKSLEKDASTRSLCEMHARMQIAEWQLSVSFLASSTDINGIEIEGFMLSTNQSCLTIEIPREDNKDRLQNFYLSAAVFNLGFILKNLINPSKLIFLPYKYRYERSSIINFFTPCIFFLPRRKKINLPILIIYCLVSGLGRVHRQESRD